MSILTFSVANTTRDDTTFFADRDSRDDKTKLVIRIYSQRKQVAMPTMSYVIIICHTVVNKYKYIWFITNFNNKIQTKSVEQNCNVFIMVFLV